MKTAQLDPALAQWYRSLPPPAREQLKADVAKQVAYKVRRQNPAFRRFQQQYFDDWPGFVADCFEWPENKGPAEYQLEIIADLQAKGREAVRGPHGLGKTTLASWVILAFALTRDGLDWKIPTTASAWRQLEKYLWPEVHKWARKLNWARIGREPFGKYELLTLNLKLDTGMAFAAASDKPDLIEGAHADHLLYVFDEAKEISDDTFDAAEGAFSGAGTDTAVEAYALAISTPGEPVGRFYDIHKCKPGYEDWHTRHVTLADAIRAGRISRQWAEQRQRQWGEHTAVYQNRVAGEFAASDEASVIPLAWIEKANARFEEWVEAGKPGTFTSVGADIGSGGEHSDKTVLALAYDGLKVDELRKYARGDEETETMQTAGRIKGILDKLGGRAYIDMIGIGLGVYHRLREQDYKNALGFNAGKKAVRWVNGDEVPVRDKTEEFTFYDTRSAGWWLMREMLDPVDGVEVALPPDDELTGELTTPKIQYLSNARIKIESKDDVKKRIKRSTDSADAVIQALTGPDLCQPEKQWRDTKFKSV